MLGRPQHVAPLLASLAASTPGCHVLFCTSPGDALVEQAIDAAGCRRLTVARHLVGDYARKINAGYEATTEPLMFTGASDLRFHPGWFEAAAAKLAPGIGVVGTNDLGNPSVRQGLHATHSLVTRVYADVQGLIDRPGAILHEGYIHEYVDNELVETAQSRGAWAMALDARVEHLHPHWGKGQMDALYAQQPMRMRRSRIVYARRRHLWT